MLLVILPVLFNLSLICLGIVTEMPLKSWRPRLYSFLKMSPGIGAYNRVWYSSNICTKQIAPEDDNSVAPWQSQGNPSEPH